jgi:5-methylthioadenosine/S-adenosylhomocysteine deaminase
MERGADIVEGELWVLDNRVTYVGPAMTTNLAFDREVDLDGDLVMPGFKNAHAHSAMTFLRSRADDLPLYEWLDKQVFPMEARLRPEQAYYLNVLAIMEYLTSGITAALDMYIYPEEMAAAAINTGFRAVLTSGVNDYVGSVRDMEDIYLRFQNHHELVSSRLGFHAAYTCSEQLLRQIAEVVRKHRAPVFLHSSENREEVRDCQEKYGKTPTEYLDSVGMFDYGGGCYRCVHMADGDLEILKKRGVAVVTNPASNCKLASGIAPVSKMLDMGITVALGTDGPASNNALDMFREMYMVTALQKLATGNASALGAETVLRMATVEGAKVMGLADCDTLSAGKLADLIVIDLKQPNMQPLGNIMANIVYAGSKSNIRLTMVNGRILYEDGVFNIGEDPGDIYEKVNFITRTLTD